MPLAPLRAVLLPLLALCACLLCSCMEERLPSGVVAEVNGRHVTLRALNTVLDSREMGYAAVPQVETLQREYGKVLAAYILYMLVDEEMTRRGMGVSDAELDALVDTVRRDYPEGGFAEVVKERGIDMAEWRLLLRYQRNLELFCADVLRPRGGGARGGCQGVVRQQRRPAPCARTCQCAPVAGRDQRWSQENVRQGCAPARSGLA